MGDRGTFEEMLNEYKSNYVQFVTTGIEAYRTAYKTAQDALEQMVGNRQKEVEAQKADMQKFAESYQEGNAEMGTEYDKAAELHSSAQKIEDEYVGAKNRYDMYKDKTPDLPIVDVSNGYAMILRLGIILFIIPIMFLIGFWSPQMNPFASAVRPGAPFTMNITSPALGSVR
jgi:hypothetical protein